MRVLTSLVLVLCFVCPAYAQTGARGSKKKTPEAKAAEELKKAAAAEGANELRVRSNVFNNVTAQAVLIPASDARRIFGKELAERYAIVELNVGNKSEDAALVIHNVFIDYSLWPLSGARPDSAALRAKAEAMDGRFGPYQSTSFPNHIASEEYRVVRGQFLNAQTWTWRNKILRWAEFAGNIAGAYTFSIKEQGFIKGIAAFNGVAVPGLRTAWPDTSLQQMNLINDVGFRTNTLVPKQGAEVIVCFFPIDRFLTPGFRKLFLKSPAIFFAPLQMLVDRSIEKDVRRILGDDLGLSLEAVNAQSGEDVLGALRRQLPCYLRVMKHAQEVHDRPDDKSVLGQIYQSASEDCLGKFGLVERAVGTGDDAYRVLDTEGSAEAMKKLGAFMALDYFAQVSLNNVGVTVDGAMTVDTTAIPPRIVNVALDPDEACGGPDRECFWSVPAGGSVVRTGTIEGAYLTGGTVAVAEGNALKITDVKTVSEGSNDQSLKFSFKLTESVPAGKRLTFRVTKPKAGSTTTVDSQPFVIPVDFATAATVFTDASYDEDSGKLTLNGSGFTRNGVVVDLVPPVGDALKNVALSADSDETTLLLTIPAAKRAPGCWEARVTVNGRKAQPFARKFIDAPDQQPKLNTAKLKDDSIEVVGENLVDASACGGQELSFELVKEKPEAGDKPVKVDFDAKSLKPTGVTLDLSDEEKEKLKSGDWKVRALLDGKVVKNAQTKLTK